MNLSDKLGTVEIKYDNRISAADRQYCETQQNAYDDARNSLSEFKMIFDDMQNRQKAILKDYEPENYRYDSYLYFDNFSSHEIANRMEGMHELFITRIVEYFNRVYKVSVNRNTIIRELLPQEPTDEYGRTLSNGDAVKDYHEKMKSVAVDYKDIIDKIFIQLGDRTFSEQALKELKEKCHDAVWKASGSHFELKNDIIHFNGYFCNYHDMYRGGYWNLLSDMVSLILALAHYEVKTTDYVPADLKRFNCYYDIEDATVEFPNLYYVKLMRLFKNGRVDIKFKNAEYASEFVREYLGTQR